MFEDRKCLCDCVLLIYFNKEQFVIVPVSMMTEKGSTSDH